MNHRKKIQRIAIIGAGAIGEAYASMLNEMDRDCISFIAAGKRAARLESEGILVNGKLFAIPCLGPITPAFHSREFAKPLLCRRR